MRVISYRVLKLKTMMKPSANLLIKKVEVNNLTTS